MALEARFWEGKTLDQLDREEWEALCDGCGKCCLHKLEDMETGEVHYTAVACRLLDLKAIRCTNYQERARLVADCLSFSPNNLEAFTWLPKTCAYRLVAEGKPLPGWHYLVSNDRETIHTTGHSIRGRSISEREAGDHQDHLWPEDEDV